MRGSLGTAKQLTRADYFDAIETLQKFTQLLLPRLPAPSDSDVRIKTIGNFIARGSVLLKSIFVLLATGNENDCWILFRALVDRAILLWHLIHEQEFNAFQEWSDQQKLKMVEDYLSSQKVRLLMTADQVKLFESRRTELRGLVNYRPKSEWRRPSAKQVAKQMDLPALHLLGYDFPSSMVHPLADDGEQEFEQMVGIPINFREDEVAILQNSLWTQAYLVHTGIRGLQGEWLNLVDDMPLQIIDLLKSKSMKYRLTFDNLVAFGLDRAWYSPERLGQDV